MSEYDKADRDCEAIQKQHGPGGQLPILGTGAKKTSSNPRGISVAPAKQKMTYLEKVKSVSIHLIPYAALSGVVFWWQQTEQLAEHTGLWALVVLALLGGLRIGRCLGE